jgi:hypothetical protein
MVTKPLSQMSGTEIEDAVQIRRSGQHPGWILQSPRVKLRERTYSCPIIYERNRSG